MPIEYIAPIPAAQLEGALPLARVLFTRSGRRSLRWWNQPSGWPEWTSVVCLEGGRTCELLKGEDRPAMCAPLFAMMAKQPEAGKPDLLMEILGRELQARTTAGNSSVDILLQTKRALVDATAAYLFKYPGHGGLTHTPGLAILRNPRRSSSSSSSLPTTRRRTVIPKEGTA
ncbi:unnamed protein product [Pylaiella littoralis]